MPAIVNKTQFKTLNDLLITKIKALYDIETQISRALPKIAKKVTDDGLRMTLENHVKETGDQVMRLEEVFRLLEIKPATIKVEAIRGLVDDTDWIIKQKPPVTSLDSMIIAACSYIEHYEMAGYIAAHRWAVRLGMDQVAELLRQTLLEEEKAAENLAELSEEVDAKVM